MIENAAGDDPELSSEQQAVVDSNGLAIVVTASAGSGKTEVVARRIQRQMSDDMDGDGRILALTYTSKAAEELSDRLNVRLGDLARRVDSETIHGFAHDLVRTYGTRVGLPVEPELLVRDEDRAELFQSWLLERGLQGPDDVRSFLHQVDTARARGQVDDAVEQWHSVLDDNGALDYGSLLVKATELLTIDAVRRQVRRLYSSVVIDEAQNLTRSQFVLLSALVADGARLAIPTMLVGDDKQSIVSFAGADPSLMSLFGEVFSAESHRLSRNYRSATVLAEVSARVASALGHTVGDAPTFAARGSIESRMLDSEADEGVFVANWIGALLSDGIDAAFLGREESGALRAEDIAVLCRTAAGLGSVASALERLGFSYAFASGPEQWLSTTAAKVVLELVGLKGAPDHRSIHWEISRLVGGKSDGSLETIRSEVESCSDPLVAHVAGVFDLSAPSELVSFLESIELPASMADAQAANWQADLRQLSRCWSAFDAEASRATAGWSAFRLFCAKAQRGNDLAPGVRLLTVHKAQGREYKAVAIVGMNDGQFPDFRATTERALVDELRTFYVAVTRARRVLLVTRASWRETRYGVRSTRPSRFLAYVSPSRNVS